jgi:glucoamylase
VCKERWRRRGEAAPLVAGQRAPANHPSGLLASCGRRAASYRRAYLLERLSSVEQRYAGKQPPQSTTWHWRSTSPIGELPAGCQLWVEDTQPFTLHFGFDNWQPSTIADQDAISLPFEMYGVALTEQQLAQHASLQFTRRFESGRENQNHAVLLNATRPATRP